VLKYAIIDSGKIATAVARILLGRNIEIADRQNPRVPQCSHLC
jgi:hypothetical protein